MGDQADYDLIVAMPHNQRRVWQHVRLIDQLALLQEVGQEQTVLAIVARSERLVADPGFRSEVMHLPPLIVLAARSHEPALLRAMQHGMTHYMLVSELYGSTGRQRLEALIEILTLQRQIDDRHLFDTLISRSADGLLLVDQSGVVQFANPAAAVLLDRSAEHLIGKPFGFPIVVGETTDIDLRRADQAFCVAEMRVSAATWKQTPTFVVALRDTTERHLAEIRLRRAENFSRSILDSLKTNVCVVDADGMITAVNQAWMVFAAENGASDDTSLGVGSNYFAVCAAAAELSEVNRLIYDGLLDVLHGRQKQFEIEYPCHAPDRERWYLMRVVPLKSEPGLVISHIDVTAQKRASQLAAEADRLRHQIELQSYELAQLGYLSQMSSAAWSDQPLRMREPALFSSLRAQYATLLEYAVEQRTFRVSKFTSFTVIDIADSLSRAMATARDLIDIHLETVQRISAGQSPLRTQACLEEGRVLVLEAMGYLALAYRQMARRALTRAEEPRGD
jgi:PAS domain-containing protein